MLQKKQIIRYKLFIQRFEYPFGFVLCNCIFSFKWFEFLKTHVIRVYRALDLVQSILCLLNLKVSRILKVEIIYFESIIYIRGLKKIPSKGILKT